MRCQFDAGAIYAPAIFSRRLMPLPPYALIRRQIRLLHALVFPTSSPMPPCALLPRVKHYAPTLF